MKKSSKANAAAGLPQFHPAHQQENLSLTRLEALLPSDKFLLRREDGGDYGVDRILEVINEGAMTNVRSHLQVKSTGATNVGDSLKYRIELKTLRYLLNTPGSIYMVYSVTNETFFWEWAKYIAIAAKERGVDLEGGQKTFTYEFSKVLSIEALEHVRRKLLEDNRTLRRLGVDGGVLGEYFMPRDDSPTLYSELLLLFLKGAYEAVISLSRVSEIEDPVTSNLIALSYYQTRNYREALKENARTLAKAPADKEAKRVRAMILCEKGIDERKRELIEEAKRTMLEIQRAEWNSEDFYNFGNMASALGDHTEAMAYFQESLKLSPSQARVWKNLANCHFNEGEHEEGLRCLERALEIDGDLIEAIISKANILREEFGNPGEAVSLLRRALSLAEGEYFDSAGIYFWLAQSLSDSGDPDEALDAIERGLDVHPGELGLKRLRVEILVQYWQERVDFRSKAVTLFQEAIKQSPKDFRIRSELVQVFLTQGERRSAFVLLCETFRELNWSFSMDFFARFEVEDLAGLLGAMGEYLDYRGANPRAPDFFEIFGIDVETAQRIEFAFGVRYARLVKIVGAHQDEEDLLAEVNRYGEEFKGVHELCSEVIVEQRAPQSAGDLSEVTTELVVALPEIVLRELSRQIGWAFMRQGLVGPVVDRQIEGATYLDAWFGAAVEPIIEGVHRVAPWTEGAYRKALGLEEI